MKILFTFSTLLAAILGQAQTLTYANFSQALSSTLHAQIADASSFNVALTTTTGNGVTWDASSLVQQSGTPTIAFIYGEPSVTPNGGLFPAANYVQYDPNLMGFLEYGYYLINEDSLVDVGNYAPSTQHEIYSDYDKKLIFPFDYGQSFFDTYAKTNYSDATTVSSYQTGTRTGTFSGYGTLILPQGTFNQVALIATERTNSLGPNSTTYTWFDITNGNQLLFYSENDGDVVVAFNNDQPSSISTIDEKSYASLYPNPFSSTATLTLQTDHSEKIDLFIYDITGKIVRQQQITGSIHSIHRDGLCQGVYYFNLWQDNKKMFSGKLIVE